MKRLLLTSDAAAGGAPETIESLRAENARLREQVAAYERQLADANIIMEPDEELRAVMRQGFTRDQAREIIARRRSDAARKEQGN